MKNLEPQVSVDVILGGEFDSTGKVKTEKG